MAIAIDPEEVREYALKEDRDLPASAQTLFMLKPLDLRDERAAECALRGTADKPGTNHDFVLCVLRGGMRGWRNFKTADGSDVDFTADGRGRPDDAALRRLSFKQRGELADAIVGLGASKLSEEDLGKSES